MKSTLIQAQVRDDEEILDEEEDESRDEDASLFPVESSRVPREA